MTGCTGSVVSSNAMPPNEKLMQMFGTEHRYQEKLARDAMRSFVPAQRHTAWDGNLDRMVKSAEIAMQAGEMLAKHGGALAALGKGALEYGSAAAKLPLQAAWRAPLSVKLLGAGTLAGGTAIAAGHLGGKAVQTVGNFANTPTQDHVAHVMTFDEMLAMSDADYAKFAGVTDALNTVKGFISGAKASAPAVVGAAKNAITGAVGKVVAPIGSALSKVRTSITPGQMGVGQLREEARAAGRAKAVAQYRQSAGSAKAQNMIGKITGQEPVAMPDKPRTMLAQERLDSTKTKQTARAAQTNAQTATPTGQISSGNTTPLPVQPMAQQPAQPGATKPPPPPKAKPVLGTAAVGQLIPAAGSSAPAAQASLRGRPPAAGKVVTPAEAAAPANAGTPAATLEQPPAAPVAAKKRIGLGTAAMAATGLGIAGVGIGGSLLAGKGIQQMGGEPQLPNVYSNYGAPIAGQASPYGYVQAPAR